MITLHTLKNTSRPVDNFKTVGRGPGSGKGKTCGRGHKGAKSRSGYRHRWRYEGGQMRLHMKLPTRGFTNARFRNCIAAVNIFQIDQFFSDGETVTLESLKERGLVHRRIEAVKILSEGELKKKLKFDIKQMSAGARSKLHQKS